MSETTQRMLEIRERLAEAKREQASWPGLGDEYIADVGFLLSLLDAPIYGPSRLREIYPLWRTLEDARAKGIGEEATSIMEKYVMEAARIYMATGVMPTFTVGGKTFNELIQAPCQPSSPSGSAAPCTPDCNQLDVPLKVTNVWPIPSSCCNSSGSGASGGPDEDDDDEGLDTPDLETAVAIPECTCPPDHPLLSGHLPSCACHRE